MPEAGIHLVIIDPQNDFCDLPEDWRPEIAGKRLASALPVAGAHADMLRTAALIDRLGRSLGEISITLDSHQHIDIGHPTFWKQADGSPVGPFTQISAVDVRERRFEPRIAGARERVTVYLEALEAAGRYTHMVWPLHCEIGTWGHTIHPALLAACNRWEEATLTTTAKIVKGTNPWTEHYSAVRAEVPDPADPATAINTAFIARLRSANHVLIAGEAGSHCVKATTEHIVEQLGPANTGKLTLLIDCMSPVEGFEAQYEAFLADMRTRGVRTANASEIPL